MLISFRHRFLFIHVPKVAGTSVYAAMEPILYSPSRIMLNKLLTRIARRLDWSRFSPVFNYFNVYAPHITAKQWSEAIPKRQFDELFKFAFVRNPWDREVSLYHYILQKPSHRNHDQVQAAGSFQNYIEWRASGNVELQSDYLTDERGQVIVNFVGRYENLAHDMDHVFRTLNFNGALPHINASAHKDYRSYYTDKTRELVAIHFQEDINRFAYSFDNMIVRSRLQTRVAIPMQMQNG